MLNFISYDLKLEHSLLYFEVSVLKCCRNIDSRCLYDSRPCNGLILSLNWLNCLCLSKHIITRVRQVILDLSSRINSAFSFSILFIQKQLIAMMHKLLIWSFIFVLIKTKDVVFTITIYAISTAIVMVYRFLRAMLAINR